MLPPDQWKITHPALDHEIDQVMQQEPWLRFCYYAFYSLWLAFNTFLIAKTWKALRRGRQREAAVGALQGLRLTGTS